MVWFQSSPVPKDGRYQEVEAARAAAEEFQSSPVPKDGRYPDALGYYSNGGAVVSILARPEGRALLHYLTRA